jgi:ABC-type lipoprotein release transport system permease subunit
MQASPAAGAIPKARKLILRPLAASTYLFRNAGKTLPLTGVIVLAVLLISGIVALLNSIPLSIKTIYSYSQESLAVTPRGDPSQLPVIVRKMRKDAPVPIERVMICRGTSAMVRSIVGKWPFVVLGLTQDDMRYFLQRQHVTGIVGRLPKPGAAEILVSEPVARNKKLKIGDVVLGPDVTDNYSPEKVRLVGIAKTERWMMLNSIEYQRAHYFPPIDAALVFAKNLKDQDKLDRWAVKQFKGERPQMLAYHVLERDTNENFSTLYRILNVVIGTLVLVITIMMGMLINIYQSQRLVEFGLLQAIGYTKRDLLKRVLTETVLVVFAGWTLGVLISYGGLTLVKRLLMDPNAWALTTVDTIAFGYTVPVPLAILTVATLTVVLRFRRFDPVSVVERRLV